MDSRINKTGGLNSTKKEEFVFSDSMRRFSHNIWVGFKKYFVLILVFIMLVTSSVYFYNEFTYSPRYQSSITFLAQPLIANKSTEMEDVYHYNTNIGMGSQLAITFPHIFQSGVLMEIVRNELGRDIDAEVEAASVANTNYFKIIVTSDTPQNAKMVADSLMKNFPKVSETVLGDIKTEIKIPSKLPKSPSNTNDKWILTIYAFVISVVTAAILLCFYAANRKNVCSKDDIKYGLNQPYICDIPFIKAKRNSKNKFRSIIKSKGFTESLRVLKNRIFDTIAENNYKTIGIVSTKNNEGKTTVAAGLAKVLSSKTCSTIVVTFDHVATPNAEVNTKGRRKPTVTLMKKYAANKVSAPVQGTKKLFENVDLLVLPLKIISNKEKTAEIFKTLEENYSYVIIDVVPGDSHFESVPLINYCDAYIPVIRCDYVPTKKIKNTLSYFSYSKARNLGVVLNGVITAYSTYGRYNNYGRYRKYAPNYYYSYGMYGENNPEQ